MGAAFAASSLIETLNADVIALDTVEAVPCVQLSRNESFSKMCERANMFSALCSVKECWASRKCRMAVKVRPLQLPHQMWMDLRWPKNQKFNPKFCLKK